MLGLVAGLFLVPRTSTPVQAVSTFVDPCAGLPSPRTFIEGQGWWRDAGEGFFDQEHIHVAACVPVNGTVSGVLPVDLTIKMHNNDVGIWRVAADTRSAYTNFDFRCIGAFACVNYTPNLTCAEHDCTFTAHLDIPTQWIKYDGVQTIRVYAEGRRADGHQTRAGFEFPVVLANGREVRNYPTWLGGGMVHGAGWHPDSQYSLAMSTDLANVPAVVSGVWTPHVFTSAAGTPITEYEVLIDPNIHALNRGIVVTEGTGNLFRNLSIDTTKLANGTHRLFFRAGSTVAKGTNSGVLVIPFTVQN